MRTFYCWLLAMLGMVGAAHAEWVQRELTYRLDGTDFIGTLVYDDAGAARRPGIVLVPNWLGPSPAAIEQAKRVAGRDYVVLVADVYGATVRPSNDNEASAAAGAARANRPLLRARVSKAVDVLIEQAGQAPLDTGRLAAVGFCFGGGSVLELARSGRDLRGVVSFHGNLDTPLPAQKGSIPAAVLVLHGADDPYVPAADVAAFESEMRAAGADWQLTAYGGAVHSFSEPEADAPGQAQYHPQVARRAFTAMRDFLTERFGP
ncbi:dienelactone hydrolase family protein [Immundisolibacter sp.]|uniref:dienelactone hydrolase family protein n=1 Tax=Immundisolibacter sp. TaxID=1934948 RepID=UPI0035644435